MKIIHTKKINSAFSLVELLTVIAIVALVAAIAIPTYLEYLLKTKANALWGSSEGAKLAVQSMYLKENTPLSSIDINSGTKEYTTPNQDFIKCITIQNGIVSVVGKPNEFFNRNVWVSWVPSVNSGVMTWACTYSNDAAPYMEHSSANCSLGAANYTADSACN